MADVRVLHPNELAREIVQSMIGEAEKAGLQDHAHTVLMPIATTALAQAAFRNHAPHIPLGEALKRFETAVRAIIRTEYVDVSVEGREAFTEAIVPGSYIDLSGTPVDLEGFWPVEAGGGCVGLRRDDPDGTYTYVTAHGDASAPIATDVLFSVGHYRRENDEMLNMVDVIGLQAVEDLIGRPWAREFGKAYAVPAEIDALVRTGVLHDESWRNDACPSFVVVGTEGSEDPVRLWVEHPDVKMRETESLTRFLVGAGGSDRPALYDGDDVRLAIAALCDAGGCRPSADEDDDPRLLEANDALGDLLDLLEALAAPGLRDAPEFDMDDARLVRAREILGRKPGQNLPPTV